MKKSFSLELVNLKNTINGPKENRIEVEYLESKIISLKDSLSSLEFKYKIATKDLKRQTEELELIKFKYNDGAATEILKSNLAIEKSSKQQMNEAIMQLQSKKVELEIKCKKLLESQQTHKELIAAKDNEIVQLKSQEKRTQLDSNSIFFNAEETKFKVLQLERDLKMQSECFKLQQFENAKLLNDLNLLKEKDSLLINGVDELQKSICYLEENKKNTELSLKETLKRLNEIEKEKNNEIGQLTATILEQNYKIQALSTNLEMQILSTFSANQDLSECQKKLENSKQHVNSLRIEVASKAEALREIEENTLILQKDFAIAKEKLKEALLINQTPIIETKYITQSVSIENPVNLILQSELEKSKIKILALEKIIQSHKDTEESQILLKKMIFEMKCRCGNSLYPCIFLECGHSTCESCATICKTCNGNRKIICRNFKLEHIYMLTK
eukprot:NODE_54_length_30443_cov_1.442954.p7 type:complete len:445 gc:universal NODE_54_length_30443_cov_1.442954:27473-28807(+)